MDTKKLYITTQDMEKLQALIASGVNSYGHHSAYLSQLRAELNKAEIVKPEMVPSDVVTMNTRVKFKDLETKETFTYWIVYPGNADPEKSRVSVLAPIGTALLGYRVSDVVEWPVPAGIRRLQIEEVLYQPEADGAFHL